MASQRIGDFWNMNLTLHYTDGNGYYEDYKSKAKFSSYKLPEYIDPEGNTVKKTDLVRRKWLDNYSMGPFIARTINVTIPALRWEPPSTTM